MWVVKAKGDSHYVDHLVSTVGFSTKETPGNDHTKGSLKFKNVLLTIEENDEGKRAAKIDPVTP